MVLIFLIFSRVGAALFLFGRCDRELGRQLMERKQIDQIERENSMMRNCILSEIFQGIKLKDSPSI